MTVDVFKTGKEVTAPESHLPVSGASFGLALGIAFAWTTTLSDVLALRGVPIHAASFGLRTDAVILTLFLYLFGPILGGYLVARFHEHFGLAIFYGAAVTAGVRVITGYTQTVSSLETNSWAELIMLRLPFGLVFGGALWFLGGAVGSFIELQALKFTDRLLGARPAAVAWTVMIVAGLVVGAVAGGTTAERSDSVAGARAMYAAMQMAKGEPLAPGELPAGFQVSGPALETLRGLGVRLNQPYELYSNNDYVYREQTITEARFQDGFVVRCISDAAWISRCHEGNIQ